MSKTKIEKTSWRDHLVGYITLLELTGQRKRAGETLDFLLPQVVRLYQLREGE
jgi:hypothetical protein